MFEVDEESGCAYVQLKDSEVVETREISPGVLVDVDDSGEVVGIEFLFSQ